MLFWELSRAGQWFHQSRQVARFPSVHQSFPTVCSIQSFWPRSAILIHILYSVLPHFIGSTLGLSQLAQSKTAYCWNTFPQWTQSAAHMPAVRLSHSPNITSINFNGFRRWRWKSIKSYKSRLSKELHNQDSFPCTLYLFAVSFNALKVQFCMVVVHRNKAIRYSECCSNDGQM